jgi:hypothetical protein
MAIDWGAKPNTNKESWQSLGAIATGVTHAFVRYRTGANGASLHPLQRLGVVPADSHAMLPQMDAGGSRHIGDSVNAPAASAYHVYTPVIGLQGSPQFDPKVRL